MQNKIYEVSSIILIIKFFIPFVILFLVTLFIPKKDKSDLANFVSQSKTESNQEISAEKSVAVVVSPNPNIESPYPNSGTQIENSKVDINNPNAEKVQDLPEQEISFWLTNLFLSIIICGITYYIVVPFINKILKQSKESPEQ
ncbi:MAG: hypothetical protein AAF960_07205 [Bacteroidota bacterium]